MQKDFHYAGTYVLARLAGFDAAQASKIARCAQYVDEATFDGAVNILEIGETYYCIRSAHCNEDLAMDFETIEDQKYNHQVWACFHFLPGNGGLSCENGSELELGEKLICKPNSYIAQEMVNECINLRNEDNALERLGVTMHVYADTWAHQEFAGVRNKKLNSVEDIACDREKDWLLSAADHLIIPALGHMQAWKHPDLPYLSWRMRKNGKDISRNNVNVFLEAADNMVNAMQRFINPSAIASGISEQDQQQLKLIMGNASFNEEEKRVSEWLVAISNGVFSFGMEALPDYNKDIYDARDWADSSQFTSWKKFHDALHEHRDFLINKLLPKYGISFSYD